MLSKVRPLLTTNEDDSAVPLVIILMMGVVGSLLEALGISLVFPLIAMINDPGIIENSQILSSIYAILAMESAQQFAMALGIIIAALFILKNLYMAWLYYVQASYVADQRKKLASRLFRLYILSGYGELRRRNSSELIRNIANLVEGPFSTFISAAIALVADGLAIGGIVIVLMIYQPIVTLLAGFLLLLIMVLQNRVFGPLFLGLGKDVAGLALRQQEYLQRSLGGFKETKVLGREGFFVTEFDAIMKRFARHMRNYQFISRLPSLATELLLILAVLTAIIILLGSEGAMGDIFATIALLAAAAFRMMPLFNRIFTGLNMTRHCHEGITILADEVATLERQRTASPVEESQPDFRDRITLENVSFRYPDAEGAALDGVSLSIHHGEYIGFVGETGSGKTTLADLLLGLLPLDDGNMQVDGVELSGNLPQWRSNVGYVPQDIFIMDDSLRRNVAFAIADDEIDDTEIMRALSLAQLNKFVAGLPGGLDARLGERGVEISGGQRQRIGIARALYHDPDLLIMDEATSSLDVKTEFDLNEAVRALKGKKTLIVISHRLSTVRECDRLIFLEKGRVAASGTYEQLAAANAEFAEMIKLSEPAATNTEPKQAAS